MKTRYVFVHPDIGYYHGDNPDLFRKILDYMKDKEPDDILLLCDSKVWKNKKDLSQKWRFPENCFKFSSDGSLTYVELQPDFFKDGIAEIMGYQYSPSGISRCVNNAEREIKCKWKASEVRINQDKVNVVRL